mgnify:CR=1 FL=1
MTPSLLAEVNVSGERVEMKEKALVDEDLDVSNPLLYQNEAWADKFRILRNTTPIHYCKSSLYGPYWSITKLNDIREIELDHATFSSDSDKGGIRLDKRVADSFISSDPPRHTCERRTVSPVTNPKSIDRYEALIRERTRDVLERLPKNEIFDWNNKVSEELTLMMLATMLDYPIENRRKLAYWSDVIICDPADPNAPVKSWEERKEVLTEMGAEFRFILNNKRRQPPELDLISMMAHSSEMISLTESQFVANISLLIVGGYDTTKNSISGGILAMFENPSERIKINKDHQIINSLVSEVFRYQTPVMHMCRTATRDVCLKGNYIKEGDRIALWYISGNRDESVFKDPDRFIIDRDNHRKHIAFGAGIHYCLGSQLAFMQLKVLWEEILRLNMMVEVVDKPKRVYSNIIRGFSYLATIATY